MGTCVCVTESLHSSPETITMLLIGYTPIQFKKFLKMFLEKEMATHSSISCLGSPMNKETWGATVHEVAKSQRGLSTCMSCDVTVTNTVLLLFDNLIFNDL